ncbi:MAG: hypothetical protein RLZZ370_1375, partial [Bacteroidota bacterium]
MQIGHQAATPIIHPKTIIRILSTGFNEGRRLNRIWINDKSTIAGLDVHKISTHGHFMGANICRKPLR